MTYLQFHLVFIMPPLLLLFATGMRGAPAAFGRRAYWTLPAICLIAFAYTTPWDNYLVYRGVWGYGEERVIGTIGYVPIEEYMFFLLQPLLVGAWAMRVLLRSSSRGIAARGIDASGREGTGIEGRGIGARGARYMGAAVYGLLTIAGVVLIGTDSGLYMGLILAWAAPVLGAQWVLVADRILGAPRVFMRMIVLPTLYLGVADRIAIGLGIWHIAPEYTTGLHLFGLPVEEALFFLVTNLLVVQAVLLFVFPPAVLPSSHGDRQRVAV